MFQSGFRMDTERQWLGMPLVTVPPDTLPSCKTVLRVLHGLFSNNMKQYRANGDKISCPRLLNSHSSRCEEEGGCSKTLNPCLLYQVKFLVVLLKNNIPSDQDALEKGQLPNSQ